MTIECLSEKKYADICAAGTVLVVTGGKEKYGLDGELTHSQNSMHYPENGERAVDISTWRGENSVLTTDAVNQCAQRCGFTHGQLESGHWHLQIGDGNGALSLPIVIKEE